MQRLRRAEHVAAERMGDHDVIANFDGEHGHLQARVIDELAEYAAPGLRGYREDARADRRNETAGASSASSCGSASELDRGVEPLAVRERRAVRRRDLADLARDQLQAAAVKRAAERHRDVARAVPAQFDDGRFVAGESSAVVKPCGGGAGVEDKVAIGGRGVRRGELRRRALAPAPRATDRCRPASPRRPRSARTESRPARRPRRRRPRRCGRRDPAPHPRWR